MQNYQHSFIKNFIIFTPNMAFLGEKLKSWSDKFEICSIQHSTRSSPNCKMLHCSPNTIESYYGYNCSWLRWSTWWVLARYKSNTTLVISTSTFYFVSQHADDAALPGQLWLLWLDLPRQQGCSFEEPGGGGVYRKVQPRCETDQLQLCCTSKLGEYQPKCSCSSWAVDPVLHHEATVKQVIFC